MNFRLSPLILALLLSGFTTAARAEDPELIVGEIAFPKRVWGTQPLPFEVTNNTDWLKFLVVETDVTFEDSYVKPHRVVRTNFVMEPSMKIRVEPTVVIPPNYGVMSLRVRVYDVVDTLDDLAMGRVVFEQPFTVRFHIPEAVIPYFQERITLPPLVGNYGLFDNEFTRLMLVLISQKKTLSEIAAMCDADTAYVGEVAADLEGARFTKRAGDTCVTVVPVISQPEAKAGRELSDRIAERLSKKITENLPRRQAVIDSMVRIGVFSGDSTAFMLGGTILYRPYPLIGGLYLWRVLGQKFIIGSRSLEIFQGTDRCNPKIGPYMYMTLGGDYFNGNHYYAAEPRPNGFRADFGDSIPPVECKPGFERKFNVMENIDWNYGKGYNPEPFLYDSTIVNPVLRALAEGTEPILLDAVEGLRKICKEYRPVDLSMAEKYWFWNLTASKTLRMLTDSGVVTRTGNGQYRFEEMKK